MAVGLCLNGPLTRICARAEVNRSQVYERKDQEKWGFGGWVTDDDRFLVIEVWRGTGRENLVFYQDLDAKD